MTITRNFLRLMGAVGFALATSVASAEVVVIVNSAASLNSATADDVAQVFLGKRTNIGGVDLVAVDQSEGSASRNTFYDKVVQKNGSQLNGYWSRLIFTGKGAPPKQVGSDAEVAEAVAEDEEAIGYVDSTAIIEGVKVIYTIK